MPDEQPETSSEAPARRGRRGLGIVHTLVPAQFGGLEQVVSSLAGLQHQAGHAVSVIVAVENDEPIPDLFRQLDGGGVDVHVVRTTARGYLRERADVLSVARRLDPDVVHTHGYRADVIHGSALARLDAPRVTTVHGFTGGGLRNRLYEWLQKRAFRRYDAVVGVSRPLATELVEAGISTERVFCVPNAFVNNDEILTRDEARNRLGLDANGVWVGFVGRLSPEKGADVFVDAMADLPERYRGAIVGGGRCRNQLEQSARDRGTDGRLRFLGVVPAAGRYMRAFDVLVLSSRTEGTPIALLEAMAANVPVVATRVGGVPGVVSEKDAFLVEPEDATGIAAAVRTAVENDRETRVRAASAGRRVRREFSPDRWVLRYDEVYRWVTSASTGGVEQ